MKCHWKHCNVELSGKQRKYCSDRCKNKGCVDDFRKNQKLRSIEYKGGKCVICGYNKCVAALDFHHLDPTIKEFGISAYGHTKKWDRVKEELDKCVLVCKNCHAELHHIGS
jgi:hypothetical protein